MPNITIEVKSQRSASDLYSILSDGSTWPKWSKIGNFELLKEGDIGNESINSVRRFSTGLIKVTEQITALVPNRSFSYKAIAGLPVKSYNATVTFVEDRNQTTIVWIADFTANVVLEPFMKVVIYQILKSIASDLAKTTLTT